MFFGKKVKMCSFYLCLLCFLAKVKVRVVSTYVFLCFLAKVKVGVVSTYYVSFYVFWQK